MAEEMQNQDMGVPASRRLRFSDWITQLDEDVIQGEFGYEDGEFDVFPDHWRPLWREGLTPQQAFRRALDAHTEARREEDAARAANWQRIQAVDAQAIEARRAATAKTGAVEDERAVPKECAHPSDASPNPSDQRQS